MKNIIKPVNKNRTWQILGYLGLLPFFFFIRLSFFSPQHFEFSAQQAFVFYSAMILSFLSGALWSSPGKYSNDIENETADNTVENNSALKIISNIFCIYAFICLLMPINNSLVFLLLGYLGLLLTEFSLCYAINKTYTHAYLKMRTILTLCVVSLHFYALYSWYLA